MALKLKHIFITIIAFFFLGTCEAQEDHLEPDEFQSHAPSVALYFKNMLPLLFKGFGEKPYARYAFIPSFDNEHAFSVEESYNKYYILSHRFSKSYWYTKNKTQVKLRTASAEIDEDFYETIGELFKLVVLQAHKNKTEILGADGEFFYLSITDNEGRIKTGGIWSPNDGTLMDRLTKVCEDIYKIGERYQISVGETETKIKQLIADLKGEQ